MVLRWHAPVSLSLIAALAGCGGDPAGTTDGATEAGTTQGPGPTSGSGTTHAPEPTTGGSSPTSGVTTTTVGTLATTQGETAPGETTVGDATTDTTTGGVVEEGGLSRRPAEPIVLVGGQVPGLATAAAGDVVGFAFQDGAWVQVAVQVDERVRVDFCKVYAEALLGEGNSPCKTTQVIEALFYADANTYTGVDGDAAFDLDDELVFMARDAGDRAVVGSEPAGVVVGSGVEVAVVDGDERGWVYLFERADGGLEPGAGVDLLSYDVVFKPAIDYKTEYPFVGKGSCGGSTCDPPILENSLVKSPNYERHFSARWVTDSLKITLPGSTGEDLLDIAQARFAPNVCGRHVLTFSTSEGAFIANIDGPVRAIRSYMGANSGPLTQRTHLFYDRMEVVQTFLRVHAIPAIMELVDYSSDAAGMTYWNDHNEAGVAIDGMKDVVDDATFAWEAVSGPHGTVVSVVASRFSQDLDTKAYYEDDAMTPNDQCSKSNTLDHPDDKAFGTSGLWIVESIPDTDPRNGSQDYVFIDRTAYYEAPDLTLEETQEVVALAQARPQVAARSFAADVGPACGDASCDAGEDPSCPFDCNPFDGSCGDGLCDLWENSINCAADCSTGAIGSMCGDNVCDPGEHELNCAGDCWEAMYEPLAGCLLMDCSVPTGACSDELPCVDRVVCVVECVGGGGNQAMCQSSCNMQIPATPEQANYANGVIACAVQNCV